MMLPEKIKFLFKNNVKDEIQSVGRISGGCISNAYKILGASGKNYFLKINSDSPEDMFQKEANGLIELQKANAIRVPEVLYFESNMIILEFIDPGKPANNFFEDFGSRFAKLHKYTSQNFGFYENNFIGATPQINIPTDYENKSWPDFYFNKRIMFQFHLAEKNGFATKELSDGIKKLENNIENIFSGSEELPSLLHGDLWSGNFICDENGTACLIDPAVYFGHREADLAMTKLFGGFDRTFYNSYNENFPLKDGFNFRENIYKLYHVLNHLNLFGGNYYTQAISLIKSYV